MPAKNRTKQYLKNGYYHIYNRGVNKRKIFKDEQDYKVFLSYLKEYLEPKSEEELRKALEKAPYKDRGKITRKLLLNNFSDKIKLLAYCLMPNHFHLLLKQMTERAIEAFMKSLGTRYVMYFNKRHKRVGGLFQGAYKAVLVETDEQLFHVSRYIHCNPKEGLTQKSQTLLEYPYSSLGAYVGKWKAGWLKPKEVLDYFSKEDKESDYKSFVLGKEDGGDSLLFIKDLVLD